MAKGFESKAVEAQQAEHQNGVVAVSAAAGKAAECAKERQRQSLELQKERILDERTSNPHRRAALAAALADIEGRIGAL